MFNDPNKKDTIIRPSQCDNIAHYELFKHILNNKDFKNRENNLFVIGKAMEKDAYYHLGIDKELYPFISEYMLSNLNRKNDYWNLRKRVLKYAIRTDKNPEFELIKHNYIIFPLYKLSLLTIIKNINFKNIF